MRFHGTQGGKKKSDSEKKIIITDTNYKIHFKKQHLKNNYNQICKNFDINTTIKRKH